MYEIITDNISGSISIIGTYSFDGTASDVPISFDNIGDTHTLSFVDMQGVEKFKSYTYASIGELSSRYLSAQFRLSRNNLSWTPWLDLDNSFSNFPPYDPKSKMTMEVKWTRCGSSDTGSIYLMSFNFIGNLKRNVTTGLSTINVNSGDQIVVKPPYIYKVFKITDLEILSKGDMSNIDIKYRFSQDYGRTVTNWEPLTKSNITTARITPIRFFQIEYLITSTSPKSVKIFDINLIGDFQNVTLDSQKTNVYGVRENCSSNLLGITNGVNANGTSMLSSACSNPIGFPPMTEEDKAKLFKPYQMDSAFNLLNNLNNGALEIFGWDVQYFLTDPDKNGIDYTIHEYQLLNISCYKTIKVSVDKNNFPDNQIGFNQFDLMMFDSFEVHISKDTFKTAFGIEKRPSKGDFLSFCETNRVYKILHAQQYRSFNNAAIYYKCMLTKHEQGAHYKPVNNEIADKVQDLLNNSTVNELFGQQNEEDKKAVANSPQTQYLTHDPIRNTILVGINKELIENSSTVISKTNYNMSSVNAGMDGVVYDNMRSSFTQGDNMSYVVWFNIYNYVVNDAYNMLYYYDATTSGGINIELSNNKLNVNINGVTSSSTLSSSLIEENVWYAYLLNVDQRQGNMTQYLYKRNVDDEDDAANLTSTKLKQLYKNTITITAKDIIIDGAKAKLIGSDMKLTNIRMFSDIIPENTHHKILNQSIIGNDTKYLVFADNANNKIILPNYQIGNLPF